MLMSVKRSYIVYVLCCFIYVFSHIFIPSESGQYSWWPVWASVVCSVQSVMAGDIMCYVIFLHLCTVFEVTVFSWRTGSRVVSSLLVRARLPCVTNFTRKVVRALNFVMLVILCLFTRVYYYGVLHLIHTCEFYI